MDNVGFYNFTIYNFTICNYAILLRVREINFQSKVKARSSKLAALPMLPLEN
jgi:hypothetical protein